MIMKEKNNDTLREIIVYTIFGILTTVVGMGTYFLILAFGEYVLKMSPDEASFNVVRVIAQILHWVFAVLFAYFTNKKWVFKNADDKMGTVEQLLRFAASRLLTLGLDTLSTFATVWILQALHYKAISLLGLLDLSADIISKIVASIFVIIANYVLSKLFVFKNKAPTDQSAE